MSNPYRDKLLGIGFLSRGRTRDKVVTGRDAEGNRTKTVIDQAGNEVTEHNNKKDQVDVHIKAPHIRIAAQEVPHDG